MSAGLSQETTAAGAVTTRSAVADDGPKLELPSKRTEIAPGYVPAARPPTSTMAVALPSVSVSRRATSEPACEKTSCPSATGWPLERSVAVTALDLPTTAASATTLSVVGPLPTGPPPPGVCGPALLLPPPPTSQPGSLRGVASTVDVMTVPFMSQTL